MANESIVVAPEPDMLARYGNELVDAIVGKAEEYSTLTFDTRENYEASNKILRTVITARTGIEKRRVELKAAPLKDCADIDAAAKYLTTLVEPIERQLKAKKDVVDGEKARVAAEKKAAEEARLRAEAEAKLKAEAERIAAERVENERKLAEERAKFEAERAEQRRIEAEREAEAKAERDRLAAEREAFELEQRKVREAQESEARKVREAQEAEQRRIEAERRAVEEQKRKAEREEAERVAAEHARLEEMARAERERVAIEERRVAELERQAALKKREEALRPDRAKLKEYAGALLAVERPELSDDDAREFLSAKIDALIDIATTLESFQPGEDW